MSLASLMVRNAVVIHPAYIEDRYGNTVADWVDDATETPVPAWLARLSESETFGQAPNRDAQISGWVLRVPAGTDVQAGDRVRVDNELFEVDGPPNRAWTPRGEHHVRVPLRQVVG